MVTIRNKSNPVKKEVNKFLSWISIEPKHHCFVLEILIVTVCCVLEGNDQ